jgi:prolyl-tRNA synthetase
MLQSKLFFETRKEVPKEEKSKNATLLIRAGFIDKLSSGVYSFLPLGFRVLKKIENIIRNEMQEIGGQELLMPAMHPKENWQKTNRWETMDDLFKLKTDSQEFALGPTHEEVIVPLAKKFIKTYKDLPLYLFQIQTKFRNEKRAKSGLLRGKEFLMKDLYSFHTSEEDLDSYYEIVKRAYFKIFKKVGIAKFTYLTYASGGSFSKYSHEFQTITSAGEDIIYICQNCNLAINKEIKAENPYCPNCKSKNFIEKKAIEVGNIFKLKTKFSEPFELYFSDKDGSKKLVQMGCYGIGLGRLLGTIVEIHSDEDGIIWPKSVAPFMVHLIPLDLKDQKIRKVSEKLYQELLKNNIDVLYDDRIEKSIGEKFVDCDLIGIPFRIILSKKTLEKNSIEIKERKSKIKKLIKIKSFINYLKEKTL